MLTALYQYILDHNFIKNRNLTPRECVRISGFPDDFNLHSLDSVKYKVFGNTVVINVIQYIIKEIIDNNYL